jgi:hypothetical protein
MQGLITFRMKSYSPKWGIDPKWSKTIRIAYLASKTLPVALQRHPLGEQESSGNPGFKCAVKRIFDRGCAASGRRFSYQGIGYGSLLGL